MSYLQYWKLTQAPFCSTPDQFFSGGSIEEAIARICFLVSSRRRLGVLVGPSSVGKTLLLQNLAARIRSGVAELRPRIVYQSLLGLGPRELFAALALKIGEGSGMNDPRLLSSDRVDASTSAWTQLQDALHAARAFHSQIVLLLDDVSYAEEPTLAGVHRILETTSPLSCVLSVCSEHEVPLPTRLQDRCQLRIDLPAWDLGQTADYFDFVLSCVHGRPGIFEAQAITRIHELGDGLPQRINRLAELALVAGASKRIPRVTSELADQVFEEFSLFQGDYSTAPSR